MQAFREVSFAGNNDERVWATLNRRDRPRRDSQERFLSQELSRRERELFAYSIFRRREQHVSSSLKAGAKQGIKGKVSVMFMLVNRGNSLPQWIPRVYVSTPPLLFPRQTFPRPIKSHLESETRRNKAGGEFNLNLFARLFSGPARQAKLAQISLSPKAKFYHLNFFSFTAKRRQWRNESFRLIAVEQEINIVGDFATFHFL